MARNFVRHSSAETYGAVLGAERCEQLIHEATDVIQTESIRL